MDEQEQTFLKLISLLAKNNHVKIGLILEKNCSNGFDDIRVKNSPYSYLQHILKVVVRILYVDQLKHD